MSNVLENLKKLLPWNSANRGEESSSDKLWAAYRVGLLAHNARFNSQTVKGQTNQAYSQKIDILLQAGKPDVVPGDWKQLYEAELLLLVQMPDIDVEAESVRRFAEAEKLGVASVGELKARFNAAGASPELKRALLFALLDDLQFRYTKRHIDRVSRKAAGRTLNRLGAMILFAIAGAIGFLWWHKSAAPAAHYHIIAMLLFGAIGAYFSRMIAFQASVADLDYDAVSTNYTTQRLLIRMLTGVIGALIMYLLITGNLVGGELFPSKDFGAMLRALEKTPDSPLTLPSSDFAKLIVWATLSGFSERLIPDQFGQIERSAKASK